MSTMIMPKFTAEASLYKTSNRYRFESRLAGRAITRADPAQLPFSLPLPGDGGDGRGPGCRPGCNPCAPDPASRTGCSQNCWTPNCEKTNRPCACPVSCGPCTLSLSTRRYEQTCQQGTNPPFTQSCEACSEETRIHIPFPGIPDKCIKFCTTGLDPSLIRIATRDC